MIAKIEASTPTASRAAQNCLETTGAIDNVARTSTAIPGTISDDKHVASVRARQLADATLERMLSGAAPTAATADVSPPTGRASQLTLTSEVVARMGAKVVGERGQPPTTITQKD